MKLYKSSRHNNTTRQHGNLEATPCRAIRAAGLLNLLITLLQTPF